MLQYRKGFVVNNNRFQQQMGEPQPVGINCDIITPTIIESLAYLVQKVLSSEEDKKQFSNQVFTELWTKMQGPINAMKEDPRLSSLVISGQYAKSIEQMEKGIKSLVNLIAGIQQTPSTGNLKIAED